jgi:cholestenol delta-isomerase
MGQFYGNLLYYTTSLFEDFVDGKKYYRPEPYYFWFYFVFMNAIWLVIPLCKSPTSAR